MDSCLNELHHFIWTALTANETVVENNRLFIVETCRRSSKATKIECDLIDRFTDSR